MNCPFYGRAFFAAHLISVNSPPFILFDQHGNQCALIVNSHSACRMELDSETPDWKTCILVRQARCEAGAAGVGPFPVIP